MKDYMEFRDYLYDKILELRLDIHIAEYNCDELENPREGKIE